MAFNIVRYSQQDPQWKNDQLGSSSDSLGRSGCAVTCVAMLLSGFGDNETPGSLNQKLKSHGGYVGAAIAWAAVSAIYSNVQFQNLVVCTDTDAPVDDIGNSVRAGQPVLLEVDSSPAPGLQTHWVVAYAKVGKDFLILDPWPYPSDTSDVSLMNRYSQGKELKQAIKAAVWYNITPASTTPPPAAPPPVEDSGMTVSVLNSLAAGLRLRSQPTTTSDTVTIEPAGTQLKVIEAAATAEPKVGVNGQWIRVRDSNNAEGYVAAWYVEKVTTGTTTPPSQTPPPSSSPPPTTTSGDSPPARSRKSVADGLDSVPTPAPTDQQLTPSPQASATTNLVAKIWNDYGSLLSALSKVLNIQPGVSVAVLAVESGGQAFASDGHMIIRFENHIFYQYWGKNNQAEYNKYFSFNPNQVWTDHKWRPTPSSPWQDVHASQTSEWQVFNFACTLNEDAARMSISMGAPQIMGFNYSVVGYSTVNGMYNAFSASARDQVIGFFDFVQGVASNGAAIKALQSGDYQQFATYYNGSGQAATYAGLIKNALDAFNALQNAQPQPAPAPSPSPAPAPSPAPSPAPQPGVTPPTAQTLIDSVNALRKSKGLTAYTSNSTLMSTAQAQADYMASTGNVTHFSADGSRPYQRALAAGYPLDGDISLGGFFSENILSDSDPSTDKVVQQWLDDAPHTNTMLSDSYQEIGGGVAVSGNLIYYCIDAARPLATTPTPTTPPAPTTPPSPSPSPSPSTPPSDTQPPASTTPPANDKLTVTVSYSVGASGLRLRIQASQAAPLVTVEPAGTKLTVLDTPDVAKPKIGQNGKWLWVQDPQGHEGYVAAWYVELDQGTNTSNDTTPLILHVGALSGYGGLRMREGPGTSYAPIKTLLPNTALTVLEPRDEALKKINMLYQWMHVRDPEGTEGYVASSYLVP